ncbi:VCBS repeat-containing protein [Fulvivirgaceae bacterium BMA12]|uniref:VCBS repeat-containing protein n=2 Tax=Agaribacillus aureus TaxID=3051825 RepID=A0ABT8KYN5_9BACT|nr:VCBS repeat-containing protein [Fulvivirgaceae bacterium BMA12]
MAIFNMLKCGTSGTFICFFFLLFAVSCDLRKTKPLFQTIDADDSGIHFSNNLVYNDSLTVLEFEYMYNGAGVGLGDINNDGLLDIYLTGNMVSGRLYLNLGNWQFEDITDKAGVTTSGWSNGVAMVDINQDGFKDIYICRGGPRGTDEKDRANLLFINNGDNSFTEAATQYGLADGEYSVQAAFFDYDRDGDLDVYLLSNALVNFNRNTSRPREISGKAPSVDKLYRNNGDNTFTNVSEEANILVEGFGLGVEICDINEDGWPDIYVSNDFLTDDLLYINNREGGFSNQAGHYLKHQTYNGMGNDVADFNNDGLVDIVVLDMLPESNRRRKLTMMGNNYDEFQTGLSYGYQPQYIRNTLQLNNGNGSFSEIGQLAGIEATDWSWSALFADYDNDGLKDLLVTNGYRQDITNLDFMVYGQQVLAMGRPEANKKQRLDALNELPGIKIHNYIYKNQGNMTFSDETESWGFSAPTYSNGAAYGDLDNDGDLDLVINNIDDKASLLKNQHNQEKQPEEAGDYLRIALKGPELNREGLGTKVYLKYNQQVQYQYFTPYRGYLSSVEPYLHFGLSQVKKIDSVEVWWPDGNYQLLKNVSTNQVITLDYHAAAMATSYHSPPLKPKVFREVSDQLDVNYVHRENLFVDYKRQPLLPHMHSRNGPGLAVGDINGDGLDDFYVGGATGYSGGLYTQLQNGQFQQKPNGLDSLSEDMGVLFFDADQDGDLDLYTASGGSAHIKGSALYVDQLYLNDGNGHFEQSTNALPAMHQSASCVVAADYDRDGDLDLFIGGRVVPGDYPMPPQSYLLRNDTEKGICRFTDVSDVIIPGLNNIGMVTSALWTDYDNDGWLDLFIAGEFMPLRFYRNMQGKFEDITAQTGLEHTSGWWNSLVGGDFDQDGDTDYLAGNLGLNSHYEASPAEPLCIYAADYDKNGRIDPVMCYYRDGINYVAHSRDDLISQINAMRARFRTYTEYAEATFEKSFLPAELSAAHIVHSKNFASSYIENLGDGKFQLTPLPVEAQLSPVFGMLADDFDLDGNLDVLLVGNAYATEVSAGRYDASIGLYLRGDGEGNFQPVNVNNSGFFADGDAKGMAQVMNADGSRTILVANNSQKLRVYAGRGSDRYFKAEHNDAYAVIDLKNGRAHKFEFYYGATYLSNSSRFIALPPEAASVTVYDFQGNARNPKVVTP